MVELSELAQTYVTSIFDSLGEGVVILNGEGKVLFINEEAKRIFEIDDFREGILSESIKEVSTFEGEVLPRESWPPMMALETNSKQVRDDLVVELRSGSIKVLSVKAVPLLSDGLAESVLVSLEDITDKRREQWKRRMLLKVVGHELKHPLANMQAYGYFFDKKKDEPEVIDKYVKKLKEQVEIMTRMINALLDISKLEEHTFTVELEEVDFSEFMQTLVDDFQVRYADRIFKTTIESDLKANIDPLRVGQVVANLVSNAVKFSDISDEIEIRVFKDGDVAVLSVRDYGRGISEDYLQRIFRPYFRADFDRPEVKGLGLGLYLCYEIVDRHGGSIDVESELGKGSRFEVRLPGRGS